MDFGSIGSASLDLRVNLAKLPGDLSQAREQVTRLAAGIEAAATSGRGFEGLSQQARTLAPAVAEAAKGADSLRAVVASIAQAVPGSSGAVAELAQRFSGLSGAAAPVAPALAAIATGTAGAAQGLHNVATAAGAAGGAVGGGTGGIGGGGGLAGAAGSAGGAFGVLNTSLASFAGYLGAIAVRKVVGDLEALGSTALSDAEDWQLAAQKIQFSLQLTREAALRERDTLMEASHGQPFGGTVQLATFLGPSVLEMGKTRAELNGLIRELGQLAIVSGASGEQAKGAFLQLGQAFAIGRLQGQDLKALTQNMPPLLDAIAAGAGKTRGQLEEMSRSIGGIPISLVFDALQKQAPAVEAVFSRMGTNVTQGMTDVKNAFEEAVGRSAESVDAVNSLGAAFESLAGFMRSSDFQEAVGPFATFVHDVGDGLKASIAQIHEWMETWARMKAAAFGGEPAPDLSTPQKMIDEAARIRERLANPTASQSSSPSVYPGTDYGASEFPTGASMPAKAPGQPEADADPVGRLLDWLREKYLPTPAAMGGKPPEGASVYDVPAHLAPSGGSGEAAMPPPRIDVEGWSSLHSTAAEAQAATAPRPVNWLTDAWGKYQGSGNPMAWPAPPPAEGPPEGQFQPGGPGRYQYERMEAISPTPTLSQTLAAQSEGGPAQLAGVTAAAGVAVSVLRELGLPTPPFSARATPTGAELPEIGGEHAPRIYPAPPPEGENQPGGPGRLEPGALTWGQVADGLRAIGVLSRPGPSDEDYKRMEADTAPPPPAPTAAQQAELAAAQALVARAAATEYARAATTAGPGPGEDSLAAAARLAGDESRARAEQAAKADAERAAVEHDAMLARVQAASAVERQAAEDRKLQEEHDRQRQDDFRQAEAARAETQRGRAEELLTSPLGQTAPAERPLPVPGTDPVAQAASWAEAKAAVEARAAADQDTAAKARESGAAQEEAGQRARQAGSAQAAVASSGERVVTAFSSLAAQAHHLEALLGGVAVPSDSAPQRPERTSGAAADKEPVAGAAADQPGPTAARLQAAIDLVKSLVASADKHPAGSSQETEADRMIRAIDARKDIGPIQKAADMGRGIDQLGQLDLIKGKDSAGVAGEGDQSSLGKMVVAKSEIAKAAEKEIGQGKSLLAIQEELGQATQERAGLVKDQPEYAEKAAGYDRLITDLTKQQTTALREQQAMTLSQRTGRPLEESRQAVAEAYSVNAGLQTRARLVKAVADQEALLKQAKDDKDPTLRTAATRALEQQRGALARYDQQQTDASASARAGFLGAASAAERYSQELEKIARASRPNAEGRVDLRPQDVPLAKEAAGKRFAEGLVTESGKDTQGKPERARDEAAIAVLLAAETGHVEARASLEEKIAQIKGRVTELDRADLDKLEQQNATIEASLAKSEAKLARLKAGAGGDISGAIDDAREAAQLSVPVLTKDEAASRYGPKAEGDRDVQREKAGDIAASTEFERQRQAALKSVATAETSYIEVVKEADARRKAGLITEQQYNRAVQGTITPLQAYREEMARIGAVEANVNLAVLKGTMSLDERRRKMLQLEADKGRAAAGERSATSRDLYDRGEAGSGTPFGKEVGGGALAGGLDIISQYGNAAKDAGELTKSFFEGTADAMTQFAMTGKADLAGLMSSLEQMAIKMTIQLLLARALSAAFGGAPAGGGVPLSQSGVAPAGFGGFMAGGWQGAAHGMAMEGGDRVPMATGGILSRETMIPMGHGGYADAGEVPGSSEAVVPLKRNARGDLGVQTDGGGGGASAPSIVINNHGEPVGQSDTKWDPDSRTLEVTIRKMVDNNIAGGAHNRAMKTAFGLSPTVRR